MAKRMPQEKGIDHTISLLREGYTYIRNRRERWQTDVFETRIFGKKTICLGGKDAAKLFYESEKFIRKNAAPNRIIETLFGKKAVQTLDGKVHRKRKAMLMSVMREENLAYLKTILENEWEELVTKWTIVGRVVFYDEMKQLLTKVACGWAGVPLEAEKVPYVANMLSALYESAAKIGSGHWKGRRARNRLEKWCENLVESARLKKLAPPEKSALAIIANARDEKGAVLKKQIRAVELVNILRPIVAISIYLNFLLLALHDYPDEKEKLRFQDETYTKMFLQEVRRFYPFFPFVAARVKKEFVWNGFLFKANRLTLLDLYGTNHDPALWENPNTFFPERFRKTEDPYTFIPQGGGGVERGHRCVGEEVTLLVMKISLQYLLQLRYDVPTQDLRYQFAQIPSMPKSKIMLENIRRPE